MSILPLPQFEADLAQHEEDRKAYEALEAPKSIVVRFGSMKLVGEFPYRGDQKPGCGSRIVVRTFRGIEVGEMLTSTCPNAGCAKSVTRKEMLDYIENSGGTDYPFYSDGRVLRLATVDDMNGQRRLDARRHEMKRFAQAQADDIGLTMKIVEAEPILGGERLTFYFTAEERIDFRDLVNTLAKEYSSRIDMRQVGARDEARLTADYERCGQHCCCKQFLKVLKPVSMRAAKMQKASLDPLKISGRCGRLMCCLRYEDQSYQELKKRLPHMKSRVGSPHGIGIVIDRQILTQLVKLRLETDDSMVAVAVEELCAPEEAEAAMAKARKAAEEDPLRGMDPFDIERRVSGSRAGRSKEQQQNDYRRRSQAQPGDESEATPDKKRRRRRRRKKTGDQPAPTSDAGPASDKKPGSDQKPPRDRKPADDATRKTSEDTDRPARKRRRRRRGRGRGQGPKGDAQSGGAEGGGSGGGSGGGGGSDGGGSDAA